MTEQQKKLLRQAAMQDKEDLFPDFSICEMCLSVRAGIGLQGVKTADGSDHFPLEKLKKSVVILAQIRDTWEQRHTDQWSQAIDFAILNMVVATIHLASEYVTKKVIEKERNEIARIF